jgi:hypothetical protein
LFGLFYDRINAKVCSMGFAELLHEIDTLPTEGRWKVLEHTRHLIEPEIPESFKLAMSEIERGEVIELDEALKELDHTP